ncbi:MAG: hypothetical protein PHD76_12520 [Methylacidiphilales bacterium]|nr:hypothetical protein [Candidatus Methylacidiphilales bacterium]
MKHLFSTHSNIKTACQCLVFLGLIVPVVAQNASKDQILQNKADQQDVRAHTAAVATQIQSLIDELAANGISGDDAKVLQSTKSALSNLSGPEMERVITSLQKAGEASNTGAGLAQAFNAYASQKGILMQFQQILKEYQQRQAAYELPLRFKELRDRQTEAMLTASDVARKTAGRNYAELSSVEQTTQQILQTDQDAIANEVALAGGQLEKVAQSSTGDDAKPLQKALKDFKEGKLQQALSKANESLKGGQLLKALNDQKIARDELHRIVQDLNAPANIVDALAAATADLAKLIEDQNNLLDRTNTAASNKNMVEGLNVKQGALADAANTVQQDLQTLSVKASGLVKESINPMQSSRGYLAKLAEFPNSAKAQQQAIAKLEEAQKQLEQQLADAQKAADESGKDTLAKLEDVKKQIDKAQQDQKQISNQTDKALNAQAGSKAMDQAKDNQKKLEDQVAALEQAAQSLSLPASQDLANAAKAMDQAQDAMSDPSQAADVQADQKAAQDALAQASQEIGQDIADAKQAEADPAALAAAADALQNAQSDVADALAAADPGDAPGSQPPNADQAGKDLAEAGQDAKTAANTPGLPADAAADVQAAQSDIAKGQQDAAKGDAAGAAAQAQAAQQALAQAQASLAMAMAGMPNSAMASNSPPSQTPGMMPGKTRVPPGQDHPSLDGAKMVTGGSLDKGEMHGAPVGSGKFLTVTSRDRVAIEQSQTEKRPQEYAPLIDQYMKNLADQSTASLQ